MLNYVYLALFFLKIKVINRTNIKEVRPDLPSIINSKVISGAELFQNETLRPILKYQHELLISVFLHHLGKWKQTEIPGNSNQDKEAYIQQEITRNKQLRSTYEGIIIAMMTIEEYQAFALDAGELRKRLFTMLGKRLTSALVSPEPQSEY